MDDLLETVKDDKEIVKQYNDLLKNLKEIKGIKNPLEIAKQFLIEIVEKKNTLDHEVETITSSVKEKVNDRERLINSFKRSAMLESHIPK